MREKKKKKYRWSFRRGKSGVSNEKDRSIIAYSTQYPDQTVG